MNFIPESEINIKDVPYFEEINTGNGWQGHSTTKSIDKLKAEIISAVERLGGIIVGFQKGKFQINDKDREGYQLNYTVNMPNNKIFYGRIDVAALPIKNEYKLRKSYESRKNKALKMALYMLKISLDGLWFLQQLSPGYSALMPWMLVEDNKTISQIWGEKTILKNLLSSVNNNKEK